MSLSPPMTSAISATSPRIWFIFTSSAFSVSVARYLARSRRLARKRSWRTLMRFRYISFLAFCAFARSTRSWASRIFSERTSSSRGKPFTSTGHLTWPSGPLAASYAAFASTRNFAYRLSALIASAIFRLDWFSRRLTSTCCVSIVALTTSQRVMVFWMNPYGSFLASSAESGSRALAFRGALVSCTTVVSTDTERAFWACADPHTASAAAASIAQRTFMIFIA